jgi:peptide/nickel transport system substrate-binding protein
VFTRTLRSLGYRAGVRRMSMDRYFAAAADPRNRAQAGPFPWVADYPAPSTFLDQFTCRTFAAHSRQNSNYSEFCDPRTDALIRQATSLQATDPSAADAAWAQAERRILDRAPLIPLFNPVETTLVSARVRTDQYSPQLGLLLDQVWVR